MRFYVAEEETLDRDGLEKLQRHKLAIMLSEILPSNAFYSAKLDGLSFDPARDPIDRLPFTTRAELQQDQREKPPFGSNLTFPIGRYTRLHQTSGSAGEPLRWLDTATSWEWFKKCWAIVYAGAGLTPADRVIFPFSFGPFIGFWAAFESAAMLGNLCLAAGGMTTAARLDQILRTGATVVCCTPTYALHMAEVANAQGVDLAGSSVRALVVAGEPGGNVVSVKRKIETQWGARVFDHAGMTEIGAWGFELEQAPGGMFVIESEFIAEVIDPKTLAPVPDGEPGELVLTNLGRAGSPLIRYRTGDQIRLTRGKPTAGRWFARAEGGVLGRIDDMLLIRGNNVFPSTIEDILREFAEVVEFRLRVDTSSSLAELAIEIEPSPQADAASLATRVADTIRDRLHFRPQVRTVAPGSLPRFELKARRVIRSDEATLRTGSGQAPRRSDGG